MSEYFAVVEAGGTKFQCAIIDARQRIYVRQRIATTDADSTIDQVVDFFQQQRQAGYDFTVLGLACFGPLDLNTQSRHFGTITTTPKPGWQWTAIRQRLATRLNCDVIIDTDVNAAVLAEYRWGAAQHCDVAVYITVGTGVGGGVVVNGRPLHGLIHPEIGHSKVNKPADIECACPFHQSCVEGLASGTAMAKIWAQPAEQLDDNHRAWSVTAQALADMCHNLMMILSPQRIILGGGIMAKPGLLEKVAQATGKSLAGYLSLPSPIDDIIVPPQLDDISGLYGGLALILMSR